MVFYLPFFNFFVLYIEFDLRFGKIPYYSKQIFNDEIIINLPYIQIIFTPRKRLLRKPDTKNAPRYANADQNSSGVPKN